MVINCMNVVIILFCLGVRIIFTRLHFLTDVCLVQFSYFITCFLFWYLFLWRFISDLFYPVLMYVCCILINQSVSASLRTSFASRHARGFSVAPPQSGTHSHLAFATLPLPISFVAFLKLTVSSRPSAPPSDSPKWLRFGHWLTLCTVNIHLLT